jgi:type II secretory ATPase GspE/PulE/Tfp pilus assembly ATPase PilB-like protein
MAFLRDNYPPKTPQDLANILIRDQLVTDDQLRIAQVEAKQTNISLEACLVTLGFISESALSATIAEAKGIDHLKLSQAVLDAELTAFLPKAQAKHYQILPLFLDKSVLRLGMLNPTDVHALMYAQRVFHMVEEIQPVLISNSDFLEAIDRVYGYEMSINGLLSEIESNDLPKIENYDNPVVRLIDALMLDAVKANASDIHFEPEGSFMRIRYRIDGLLRQIRTLHSSCWPTMCVRLKIISQMNIAESRHPQNGRFSMHIGTRDVDFRTSSHPTVHGENVVVRILDKSRSLVPLGELGYSSQSIKQLEAALLKPEGMVVITGPTGSGKTTSLYSLLQLVSSQSVNIMTLEEPVEYSLPLVRQTTIHESLSYAEGIKSILRQDPDVILIGEIRDETMAQMALRASMTGHRVFTTLHTQDALGVIFRLEDLGLQPNLLAGNLTAIISQRLVRRLCDQCKHCRVDQTYEPVGCELCECTGFVGRIAIAEVITLDAELNDLILTGAPRTIFTQVLSHKGFISMAKEARAHIANGTTSLCETRRVVDMRDQL